MSERRAISDAARKRLNRLQRNNRYRARKKGAVAEPVDFIAQLDAQDWMCCLCGQPMDPDTLPPDGMSISLEHDFALGWGGHHTPRNVKGAHLACNMAKGREEDTKRAAKIKRQRREKGPQSPHRKKRKIQSPGFQTNKSGPFKRTLDGRVVRRDSQ